MKRLAFNQELECAFNLTVDPGNQHESILAQIGVSSGSAPISLDIPYTVSYSKYPRSLPISDAADKFTDPLSLLSFNMAPLYTPFVDVLLGLESCRFTSSVAGSSTENLFNQSIGKVTFRIRF